MKNSYVAIVLALVILGCVSIESPIESSSTIQNTLDNNITTTQTHWEATENIPFKGGGKIEIDQLLSFKIRTKSMSTGVDTKISVTVDLLLDDTHQMLFHFEPSGLLFDPSADLTIKWHKLDLREGESLKLYYLPNGINGEKVLLYDSDNPSKIYKWDKTLKLVHLPISHFSLYALSKN